MRIPSHMVVRKVMITNVEQENREAGVYRVQMTFDGIREEFIIELNRPERSFAVRGFERWGIFEEYAMRSLSMKAISRFMHDWRRGERPTLPFDLADLVEGKSKRQLGG